MTPGSVLFGAYEIITEISSGGMGCVYRARHLSLHESRAIKVMRPEMAADPRGAELFLREARALLEVTHDAVSRCHDLLRDEDGRLYLVTELVDGPSLGDFLRERKLTPRECLVLCERLAEGLDAVHARGVVHRDLSPDNILLPMGELARAKIIDFGVARIQDTASTALRFKGKLAYASPEQLGLFGGELDARSDLYSLGLLLAECLTAEPLCPDRSILQAIHRRQQRIALPRRIPAPLRQLLDRLLSPDPKRRMASAAELALRAREARKRLDSRLSTWITAGASALLGAGVILGIQLVGIPSQVSGLFGSDSVAAGGASDSTTLPSDVSRPDPERDGTGKGFGAIASPSTDLRDDTSAAATPSADLRDAASATATPSVNLRDAASAAASPSTDLRDDASANASPSADSRDDAMTTASPSTDGRDAALATSTPGFRPDVGSGLDAAPASATIPEDPIPAPSAAPIDPASDAASEEEFRCTPEQARTRASYLYTAGSPCDAVSVLDRCCPTSDRRCRDMRVVLRARCRARR